MDNLNEIKINNSSVEENKLYDPQNRKLLYQIESLHCLFTWKLKSQKEQDIIWRIKNKYGDHNLDISLPEFTFVRFIGNLIISYELYQNGDTDASDMKIVEIGKWLEKLDAVADEFFQSINIGLKHIKIANFIHMQYAVNDVRGFKQLFKEIVLFDDMENKSKAAIYAVHAVILIEYGEDLECFKNAREYANKACMLDPGTSHWLHIYSLVLIAQKQFSQTLEYTIDKSFLLTNNLYLEDNEINLAIQKAVTCSGIKNTCYVNSLVLTALNQFFANDEFQVETDNVPILKKDISEENMKSSLEKDMKIIVEKHKNGEDAIPYLIVLVSKYKHDRWKIIAQICSYTILFTNNFRAGVKQFLMLLEEPEISMSEFITHHNSPFIINSKPFNLAELICSEIRFATANSNCTSIEDILFYYKIFLKIEETCIPKMKIEIPLLKTMPVSNSFTKSTICQDKKNSSFDTSDSSSVSTCSSVSYQDEYDISNNESDIDKSENIIIKKKTRIHKRRKKHLQNIGLKLFTDRPILNQTNYTSKKNLKIKSVLKNTKSKMQSIEKYLMDFSISNVIPFENVCPSKSSTDLDENFNYFQLQTELYNLQNTTTQNHNTYLNQNIIHFDFLQQFQGSTSIPLLDLKLDLNFQSKNYTINDFINSSSITIDTSLSILPRLLTNQKTYKLFLKYKLLNYPNSFKIYTDASKIQNNVGIAMVSDKDTYTYKLSSKYTSCDAEAVAILLALDYAIVENYNDYLILTDSLTTVTCIQNKNISSDVMNSILHLIYINQLKGKRINFIWIPSHNSIEGNEKADRLAKQIATSPTAIVYSHTSFMKT